jgi:hypothetical protein
MPSITPKPPLFTKPAELVKIPQKAIRYHEGFFIKVEQYFQFWTCIDVLMK